MHFGTADRHAQADSARNNNVAAVISSGEKVDQSEISVPSTPPAGQLEIHGVEEHQLQEGELPPLSWKAGCLSRHCIIYCLMLIRRS